MKIVEIEKRISAIKEALPDYEKAHSLEDDLYLDFIEYVTRTTDDKWSMRQKARMIRDTRDIKFSRYCA